MEYLLLSRGLNGDLLERVLLSQDIEVGLECDNMVMEGSGKTVVDLEPVVFVLGVECGRDIA